MLQSLNLEVPIRVLGPDGTVLFQGSGWFGVVRVGVCKNVAITQADAVALYTTNFIIQADNLGASATWGANVLAVQPTDTDGSFDRHILGVAMNSAALNAAVAIAGPESIVPVRSTVTGTVGQYAAVTTTAGACSSSATASIAPIQHVGVIVKAGGTTAQPSATDTGSASRMGIIVRPGSDNSLT